jgi:hypothetical protein
MMYRARREAFIAGCIAAAASGEGLFKQFPPGNVVFSPIVDDAIGAILFQGRIVDPQ